MNILISSAGRRNELISYFKANPAINKVVVCDMSPYATAFEESDEGYIAPSITDSKYESFLYELCKKESIALMFTLNDLELPLLSKMKKKLNAIGTVALVSDTEIIDICWDKSLTTQFLEESGFCIPSSYTLNEIDENFNSYPVIIKPRFGTASIGVEVATSHEEFKLFYAYAKLSLNKTLIKDIEGGGDLLIQEKVAGIEYAVDIINDLTGHYQGCVIKKKIGIRGGDADCVISVYDEKIEKWCQQFSRKLKHIGNVDCDLICRGDEIYCVDINPRFGGAYPFSHLSGINLPEMIIAWINNTPLTKNFNYSTGVITARAEKYLILSKTKNLNTLQ